jgi:hypothetical protein
MDTSMKIIILSICLFCVCGCATTDTQTIYMLNQRIQSLEKGDVQARGLEAPPNYYNANPDKLNEAQKDFVQYMLNYLADEE